MDINLLVQAGLKPQDILLVIYCPLCAALGSLVHGVLLESNFSSIPSSGGVRGLLEAMAVLKWFVGRVFVGGVLGLVLALYFVGSLTENPISLARVLALAVLIGYSAPRLWLFQEHHVMHELDRRIQVALGAKQESSFPSDPSVKEVRNAPPRNGPVPL